MVFRHRNPATTNHCGFPVSPSASPAVFAGKDRRDQYRAMLSGNTFLDTKLAHSLGNSHKQATHGSADSADCTVPEAVPGDRRLQDDAPLVRVVRNRRDDIAVHIAERVAVVGLALEQSRRSAHREREPSRVVRGSSRKPPDSMSEDTEPTLPQQAFATVAEIVPLVVPAALVVASAASVGPMVLPD